MYAFSSVPGDSRLSASSISCLHWEENPRAHALSCGELQGWRSAKLASEFNQNMDMSNPAAFVNAELLHFYVGRRVRALMQVVRSDGGVVIGKSTDEKQLVVKGSPPAPLTTFVEVFGIVNSDKSIAAEIWTNFGDSIDMFSYNKLCQLANGELRYLFLDSILHWILCTEECETYETIQRAPAFSVMPFADVKTLSKDKT
ncbi:hypothetical protein VNO80_04252 [Phaseolus coccineus]|uniref:Replication protein A 14 kDa subunit B n=1 Tax=Phaseolus coccineus TaxID=3886 RepID=A0AAN9NYB4_PHACN